MENLDDFIKGKLAQDPIVFSEAHWMKAAKLIEEQEWTKRKRFVIWSFFAQLIVLAIVFLFVVNLMEIETPIDTNPRSQVAQVQEDEPDMLVGNIARQEKTIKNKNNKHEDELSSNEIPENNGNNFNPNLSKSKVQIDEIHKEGIKKADQSLNNSNINPQIEAPSISQKTVEATENLIEQYPKEQFSNNDEFQIDDPIIIRTHKPDVLTREKTTNGLENNVAIVNPTNSDVIHAKINEVTFLSSKINYLDYNFEENFNRTTQLLDDNHSFGNALSLYIGSSLYPYAQVGAKGLIAYTAGLNYSVHLKQLWHLETAIHYRLREGSFGTSQTTTQDSFAFRKISTEHSLIASELHTLEIPLAVAYTKHRHQIQLGINYARLLGVKGKLNKIVVQENPSTETIQRGWLEEDGFNVNRLELMLGYYYTFKPGLKVGFDVHYMIGDLVNKDSSSGLVLESKPLFIDFGVRYDLLKR